MPTRDSPRSRGGGGGARKLVPEKSASFHGRLPTEHRSIRRPKTLPDLLEGRRASPNGTPPLEAATAAPAVPSAQPQRVPTKVLVNVTVQRSLGPVQVVASTDWTVGQLVAAVLQQYAKEARRPLLTSADPSAFGLHYSQFSLECLEAGEKLIGLGSRSFFLCPKKPTAAPPTPGGAVAAGSSSSAPEKTCSKEAAAEKATKGTALPWLRFMDFLL